MALCKLGCSPVQMADGPSVSLRARWEGVAGGLRVGRGTSSLPVRLLLFPGEVPRPSVV